MNAAAGALLAALLGFAAFGGQGVTALAVGFVQAVLLVGWLRSARVPDPLLGVVLAGAVAVAADVLVLTDDGSRPLSPVALVLGPSVVVALLHQLLRRAPRPGVTVSLTTTVLLVAVVALAALHIAARGTLGGAPLVAAVAAGAGVSALLWAVPLPKHLHRRFAAPPTGRLVHPHDRAPAEPLLRTVLCAGLGAVAGVVVGAPTDLAVGHGAWLGATAGVVAGVGRLLAVDATSEQSTADGSAAMDPPSAPGTVATGGAATQVLPASPAAGHAQADALALLVVATLPLALTGVVSYVLGRILVG